MPPQRYRFPLFLQFLQIICPLLIVLYFISHWLISPQPVPVHLDCQATRRVEVVINSDLMFVCMLPMQPSSILHNAPLKRQRHSQKQSIKFGQVKTFTDWRQQKRLRNRSIFSSGVIGVFVATVVPNNGGCSGCGLSCLYLSISEITRSLSWSSCSRRDLSALRLESSIIYSFLPAFCPSP